MGQPFSLSVVRDVNDGCEACLALPVNHGIEAGTVLLLSDSRYGFIPRVVRRRVRKKLGLKPQGPMVFINRRAELRKE